MESTINMPAVFAADGFGILVLTLLLLSGSWKIINNSAEARCILRMIICCFLGSIYDSMCFYFDGKLGTSVYYIVYITNLLLYVCDLVIAPLWIKILSIHILGRMERSSRIVMYLVCGAGCALLILNVFTPIVFSVDEQNIYHRGPLFFYFAAVEILLIAYGLSLYFRVKRNSNKVIIFPALQFIVPTVSGIVGQSLFYGVSLIWPTLVIAVGGLTMALQNEAVYRDSLTGLYNRFYIDCIRDKGSARRKPKTTAIMLDINGFKEINDKLGHAEGDRVLVKLAKHLNDTVGSKGDVMRYAGDEFIIMLKTQESSVVRGVLDGIRNNMPEGISASIGYAFVDMSEQSVDEMFRIVDDLMYREKREYYEANELRERRK